VGHNPLCGDKLVVYLTVEDDIVKDASFQGVGCAISTASASLMTEAVIGKTAEEADRMFLQFQQMVMGESDINGAEEELGKLAVFAGVRDYPARVKCATLAWHTVHSALTGSDEPASTE